MALPKAEAAYSQHKEAMISALENPAGVRVRFLDYRDCVNFRHMCHTLRSRERKRAERGLPEDQKTYAATAYDNLVFICKRTPTEQEPGLSECQILTRPKFEIELL